MSPVPFARIGVCVLLMTLAGGPVRAQQPATPLRLLYHTAWTNRDGAPADVVGLAQTDDGFLWLGTTTGLFRFDGVHFEAFAPRAGESLPSRNIASVHWLPGGPLWVGYRFGGASAIEGGRLTNYGDREGFPKGSAYIFVRDSSGATWTATSSGLARLAGGRWHHVGAELGFDGVEPTTLFVDRRGTLWVSGRSGVFARGRRSPRFTRWAASLGYGNDGSIQEAPDGTVWGTSVAAGTIQLTDSLGQPPRRARRVGPVLGLSLLIGSDSSAWVASATGVARGSLEDPRAVDTPESTWQSMTIANGLSGRVVISMLEDREHNIWLGTSGGLDRFRRTKLTPLAARPPLVGPAIAPGDRGAVWVGSHTQPLRRVPGAAVVFPRTTIGITSAYRDLDGGIWLGAGSTVWRVMGSALQAIRLPAGIAGDGIQAIARDRAAALWVSVVRKGVFRLDSSGWSPVRAPPGMEGTPAVVAVADSSGRVWLGYTQGRLILHDRGTMRLFTVADGLRVGNVTSVHVHGGDVWVGGELGLARWDGTRFHSVATANPAGFAGVSGIVETARGEVWLNSAAGVSRIPAAEVAQLRDDVAYAVREERFDFRDGITGVAPQIRPLPSAIQGTDGRLWFSMSEGVVSVDPAHVVRDRHAPPVHVTRLMAANAAYSPGGVLRLPPGTRDLHFTYTALAFANPDRIRFRVRLVGSNDTWQEAGSRREAFYTNLGPGRYRFEVTAANEDGYADEKGDAFEFVIPPTFAQTKLFLALVLALMCVAVWALTRMRSRQLLRAAESQFEVTLAERTRIAQELHDTLLQGFAGVALQLHALAAHLRPLDAGDATALRRIISHVEDTLKDARRRVWDLRAPELDDGDLPDALAAAGREAVAEHGIAFTFEVHGVRRPLPRLVEVTALRVVREALVNCTKHSRCSAVHLAIDYEPDALRCIVRDNGVGLVESDMDDARRTGHWGIVGMRERATSIGGTVVISAAPGNGTTVRVTIPVSVQG